MVQATAPEGVDAPRRASVGKRTLRVDRWWAQPHTTWVLLGLWVVYATVRVFTHSPFYVGPETTPNQPYHYLSPFVSPCVTASCPDSSREFGTWFGQFPPVLPYAIITLVFLLGFRMTCYYYRKAYYRAFWRAPSACAVPEPHGTYRGETRFPLIIQNAHRYFFYLAVIISLVNTYDVVVTLEYGIGVGTLIMIANVILLWAYTLGCHACRHAVGGQLRHFSRHPVRYRLWKGVTVLTNKHMQFAWTTLGTLMLTDWYIWMVSSGVFADLRFANW
jgi:hypothetical protein